MAFKILGSVLPASRGRWLAGVAFAGLMGLSGSASALSVFIDWSPAGPPPAPDGNISVQVGDSVTAGVYAQLSSGSEASSGLTTFGVDFGFDPSVLKYTAVTPGADWGTVGTPPYCGGSFITPCPTFQVSPKAVSDLRFSPVTGTSPIHLFDITLQALSVSSGSQITLGYLGGYINNSFKDGSNKTVSASFVSPVTVTVTPVPLPPAFWMMGSGLVALFGLRQKIGS